MSSYYPSNREPLPETAFTFLPLGHVKPQGWLKKQLQIQADSLTGNLPKFWDSLGPNSGWLGGDGESWERGPYYTDGLVPLAYILEDENLLAEVDKWIGWMLESQDETGHFGPKALDDWWPFGVALKTLTQYQEATGDERVIPLMEKFFAHMKRELPKKHLRSWAIVRWADTALAVIWLYNRTGDESLLELARELMYQGYNWTHHFNFFSHFTKQEAAFNLATHVVNNAMGIKTPAVAYELTGWDEHKEASWQALRALDKHQGAATGVFSGDEHWGGKDPSRGTELCAVVEYQFSLENLIQVLGDPAFCDRLEKITYNALPGTFTADMWGHQYDQQPNQVQCSPDYRPWTNNDYANTFGVEPNFGCCTANMHQGWPKFVANLWMATNDDGLAAVAYGPCRVYAEVRGGVDVMIDVETDYPWDETIKMTVNTTVPAEFPLKLRVPTWAAGASIKVNGEAVEAEPGTFVTIERKWRNGDVVELVFPMKVEVERRYHNSVTVKRGPIVYSLKIGERWEKIGGEEPHPDYAVYPTTPWNYGLVIDPESPEVEVIKKNVGDVVYGPEFAPMELKVTGRRVQEWAMEMNSAGPLPQSPVKSTRPDEELTLIPYGCAKLRITEFPLIDTSA